MIRKRFLSVVLSAVACALLAFACLFSAVACAPEEPEVKTLTKIEVTKEPTRTEFYIGETFDKSGMRVAAFYSDKTAEVVTNWTYEPTTPLTEENDTITITYTEDGVTRTCTQAITVVPEPLRTTGIKIATPPTKTEYIEGEKFDIAGMKVVTVLSDGTDGEDVTADISYAPYNALTVDDKEITVTYEYGKETFTAKQSITVNEGVATIPFGGGTYEKAHDIILGTDTDFYELSGIGLENWTFNGTYADAPFKRVKIGNANQTATFTFDFSGVEDKSQIGFSANMIKVRARTIIQVSTDKQNWEDLGYQYGGNGVFGSEYAEQVRTLSGRPVSDPNLYRVYYSLAEYADRIGGDGLIYVRFGFSNKYENALGDNVGADVIDGVTYYEKLTLTNPDANKYTLTLGEGVTFADGGKTALLKAGKAMPEVVFEDSAVEIAGVSWTDSNGTVWKAGKFIMPAENITVEYSYSADKLTLTLGEGMSFEGGAKTALLRAEEQLPAIIFEDDAVQADKVYFIGSNGKVWEPGTFNMPEEDITLEYYKGKVINPYKGNNGYSGSKATEEGHYLLGDGGYSHQPKGVQLPNNGRGELTVTDDGKLAQLYNLPNMMDGYAFRLQTTPKRASNTDYTYNIDYTFYNKGESEIRITVYQINSGNTTTGCKSGTVTIPAGEKATANLTGVGFAGDNNFLTYFVFNGVTAESYPVAVYAYITPVAVIQEQKTLTKIEVTKAPDKTEFYIGETFDKTGMVITAFYDNETSKEVTGWTFEPTAALTEADNTVTISYTEDGVTKTCTQTISVVPEPPKATGIKIAAAPTKTEYTEGETFDITGMQVVTVLSDGTDGEDVTAEVSFAPSGALTAEDNEITISYAYGNETFTVTQSITVNAGVATITFGGGTYEKAHDIILGTDTDFYELSVLGLGDWTNSGHSFKRVQSKAANQSATFKLDFSGVEDKSQIGFSVNMIKARARTLIQVSTDKQNWEDFGYQYGNNGVFGSEYAEPVTTLGGNPVSDPNLYRVYYSLAEYADGIGGDGLIYIRFGFSNNYESALTDNVGADVIDGVAYYEKLIFTDPNANKYTLTLGDGVTFANGEKTALLKAGKVMPEVVFADDTIVPEEGKWVSGDKQWNYGEFMMPAEDITLNYVAKNTEFTLTLGEGMTFAEGAKTASLKADQALPDITFEDSSVNGEKVFFIDGNKKVWTKETFLMPAKDVTLEYYKTKVVNPDAGKGVYTDVGGNNPLMVTEEGQYLIGDAAVDTLTVQNKTGELVATSDGKLAQLFTFKGLKNGSKGRFQSRPLRESNSKYTYDIEYVVYNYSDAAVTITLSQVNGGTNINNDIKEQVTIQPGESATITFTNVGWDNTNKFLTILQFDTVTSAEVPLAIYTYITPTAVTPAETEA